MSKQLKNWVKSSFCLSEECFSLKWRVLFTQVKRAFDSILSEKLSSLNFESFSLKIERFPLKIEWKWLKNDSKMTQFTSQFWVKMTRNWAVIVSKALITHFSVIFAQNWVVLTHFWNFTRSTTINYLQYGRFSTLSNSVWSPPWQNKLCQRQSSMEKSFSPFSKHL